MPSAITGFRNVPGTSTASPIPLNGLLMFMEAKRITSGNGSAISLWADQSGNGNNLGQATTSQQPVLVATGLNGKPALQFASSSSQNMTGSTLWTTGERSLFVVYQGTRTNPPAQCVAGQGSAGSSGSWYFVYCRQDSVTGDPYFSGYANDITGPTPNQLPKYVSAIHSSGTTTLYNGGATVGSVTFSPNTTATFRAGNSSPGNSDYFDGYIGTIIAYNRAVTAAERAQIEAYLKSDYGL